MNLAPLIIFSTFFSCGFVKKKDHFIQFSKIHHYQRNYKFTDISGRFLLSSESGLSDKNKAYMKMALISEGDNQEYEKTVSISKLGWLKTKNQTIRVLRPEISQYTVWLDGKKYFSQIKIDSEKKILKISTRSPEKQWNGVEEVSFKNSRGLFCFFNQIPDCIRVTKFLSRAIMNKAGKMSLTIIWEGHPYIREQYAGVETPFSTSILSYDGISKEGNFVFNLNFSNQVLFYHFNNNAQLEKKFWISQGMSQEGL